VQKYYKNIRLQIKFKKFLKFFLGFIFESVGVFRKAPYLVLRVQGTPAN
jgi:hypothetical protein